MAFDARLEAPLGAVRDVMTIERVAQLAQPSRMPPNLVSVRDRGRGY